MPNPGIASPAAFLSGLGPGSRPGGGTMDRNRRRCQHATHGAGRVGYVRPAGGHCPLVPEAITAKGWVLRWMGSGEVCSDYASILCMPDDADRVTEAVAAYLTGPNCACGGSALLGPLGNRRRGRGRSLRHAALAATRRRGCSQHENSPVRTWRLALPKTWEEFLRLVSKCHREKLRRAERKLFQTGRAVMRTVENCEQLDAAMDLLIDLHQQRWRMLGEPGCFTSSRFAAFHARSPGSCCWPASCNFNCWNSTAGWWPRNIK